MLIFGGLEKKRSLPQSAALTAPSAEGANPQMPPPEGGGGKAYALTEGEIFRTNPYRKSVTYGTGQAMLFLYLY